MSVTDLRGILISSGVKVRLRIVKARNAAVNVSKTVLLSCPVSVNEIKKPL